MTVIIKEFIATKSFPLQIIFDWELAKEILKNDVIKVNENHYEVMTRIFSDDALTLIVKKTSSYVLPTIG